MSEASSMYIALENRANILSNFESLLTDAMLCHTPSNYDHSAVKAAAGACSLAALIFPTS